MVATWLQAPAPEQNDCGWRVVPLHDTAATTVTCGAAVSCSGTTRQPQSFCSGAGACNQVATISCGNYVCDTNSQCRTNCTSDAHCSSTSLYCAGNSTT